MKRLVCFWIVPVVLSLIISCTERIDHEEPESPKYVDVSFVVGLDTSKVSTKTYLDPTDGKVCWSVGDTVRLSSVLFQTGVGSYPLTSKDISESKTSAKFTFRVPAGQETEINKYDSYLYYGKQSMSYGYAGKPASMVLDALQYYEGTKGFSEGENASFGYMKAGDTTCVMRNIFAILKVNISLKNNQDIEYVQLINNGNQHLAGTFGITGIENNQPALTYQASTGGNSKIVDKRIPSGVSLTKSGTFYFMVPPSSLNDGFDVLVYTRSGYYGGKRITIKTGGHFQRSTITEMTLQINEKKNPDPDYTNTANSYIIPSTVGLYTIPAQYKGNGYQGNRNTDFPNGDIAPQSGNLGKSGTHAEVIWQTKNNGETLAATDVVSAATFYRDQYENGYITVRTTGVSGNALVALKDASDNILWSWHLWITNDRETINQGVWLTKNNSGTLDTVFMIMDRNLGALYSNPSQGCQSHGLAYQYGRKDPFMSARFTSGSGDGAYASYASIFPPTSIYTKESTSVTVEGSISVPFIRLMNDNGSWCSTNTDWGDTSGSLYVHTPKNLYDPCPEGWRVIEEANVITLWGTTTEGGVTKLNKPVGSVSSIDASTGKAFTLSNNSVPVYFPATGYAAEQDNVRGVGSNVWLWGSTSDNSLSTSGIRTQAMSINISLTTVGDESSSVFEVGTSKTAKKATMPVRCQRWNEPGSIQSIPAASQTTKSATSTEAFELETVTID